MTIINVFTDGSFVKRKKNGKQEIYCGYGIYFPDGDFPNISRKFERKPLTNQRAELFAIYVALLIIMKSDKSYNKIIIHTDSEYSINSLTKWIYQWAENNWKTSNKTKVKNQDILKPLFSVLKKITDILKKEVELVHVRSHTGKTDYESKGNEMADKLATTGALS